MAKSFKNVRNPAKQFISAADEVKNEETTSKRSVLEEQLEDMEPDPPVKTELDQLPFEPPVRMQTPILSPASTPDQLTAHMIGTKVGMIERPPAGYRINPIYIEKKNQSVHVLMRPSLREKSKIRARQLGISVNEYYNILIDADTKDIEIDE